MAPCEHARLLGISADIFNHAAQDKYALKSYCATRLSVGGQMELIYSLAKVTVCPFLSKEHYEQCGNAGIGRGLKRCKNLAQFFGAPEDNENPNSGKHVSAADARSKIAPVNCSFHKDT